jgi:haloalkane dehalogenase
LVIADPGVLVAGRARDFCRSWKNQREITVPGIHFVQEDSPHETGLAIQSFVKSLVPLNANL